MEITKSIKRKSIVCPLCDANCQYEQGGKTHIWICEECPFVGFEYYDIENTLNLSERLNPDWEIKVQRL